MLLLTSNQQRHATNQRGIVARKHPVLLLHKNNPPPKLKNVCFLCGKISVLNFYYLSMVCLADGKRKTKKRRSKRKTLDMDSQNCMNDKNFVTFPFLTEQSNHFYVYSCSCYGNKL